MVGKGPDGWSLEGTKISDPTLMHRIQDAFATGPVFVRFALLRGGGGPNWEVFVNYEQFLNHLSHAKPGDWYTVWSVGDWIQNKKYFLRKSYERLDPSSEEFQSDLATIKQTLDKISELLLIGIGSTPGEEDSVLIDYDGYDVVIELGQQYAKKKVEFIGFNWESVEGSPIVDAKVPNADGEVPLGGVY